MKAEPCKRGSAPGRFSLFEEHSNPKTAARAHVLLIEPKGTPNTGDADGELTAHQVWI